MSFIFKFFHSSILSNSCSLLTFSYLRSSIWFRFISLTLLLPRQHLSKTCLHLHLYSCFWMFHAQTWRTCSCVALLVPTKRTAALSLASQLHLQDRTCRVRLLTFTQKSLHLSRTCLQVHFWLSLISHFTSQERACKCTFDFHSEVTSPLKNVLAGALVTFTHKSLRCDLHPIREGLPLWHWFLLWSSHPALASLILPSGTTHPAAQDAHCGLAPALLWCSHPALASLILPSEATHPAAQDTHCGLGFARGAVSAQILPQGATRPTGQGRTLLFPILFVAQVPAHWFFF